MKRAMVIGGVISSLMMVSCRECLTEPEKVHYTITLSVKETAPQYVRLYFAISDSGTARQFELKQDSNVVITGNLLGKDTVVTISHLNPSTEYRYQLLVLDNDEVVDSSLSVNVTTPETSGDDFTWDVQTLGDYGSYLRDVWIVDENNIYAVGNIDTGDGEFNTARWNGNEWKLLGAYSNTLNLYRIWYFSENDIWVTDNSFPIHWMVLLGLYIIFKIWDWMPAPDLESGAPHHRICILSVLTVL